jgi:hypothetical protein
MTDHCFYDQAEAMGGGPVEVSSSPEQHAIHLLRCGSNPLLAYLKGPVMCCRRHPIQKLFLAIEWVADGCRPKQPRNIPLNSCPIVHFDIAINRFAARYAGNNVLYCTAQQRCHGKVVDAASISKGLVLPAKVDLNSQEGKPTTKFTAQFASCPGSTFSWSSSAGQLIC